MSFKRRGLLSGFKRRARLDPARHGAEYAYVLSLLADPCAYCGRDGCDSLDHIVPFSRRDELADGFHHSHWSNLVGCHAACNQERGARSILFRFIGL